MANELTEAERMTKFETQMENLVVMVARMDQKIDNWQANFVSKELLEEKLKARDNRLDRMEQEKSSNKNTLPLWVAVVFSCIDLIYLVWPKK